MNWIGGAARSSGESGWGGRTGAAGLARACRRAPPGASDPPRSRSAARPMTSAEARRIVQAMSAASAETTPWVPPLGIRGGKTYRSGTGTRLDCHRTFRSSCFPWHGYESRQDGGYGGETKRSKKKNNILLGKRLLGPSRRLTLAFRSPSTRRARPSDVGRSSSKSIRGSAKVRVFSPPNTPRDGAPRASVNEAPGPSWRHAEGSRPPCMPGIAGTCLRRDRRTLDRLPVRGSRPRQRREDHLSHGGGGTGRDRGDASMGQS